MITSRVVGIVLALIGAAQMSQAQSQDREAFYTQTALSAAARYRDQPRSFTYSPAFDPKEVAASTIAIQAHILLEAFKIDGDQRWLDGALVAGKSLVAHSDMNKDGKIGWGRFWALSGPSGDNSGGNTSFASGCNMPRTKAYDDELYDDARINHFLVELSNVTKDGEFLDIAKKSIDDTWNVGAVVDGGKGFAYFKTIGPCDNGWLVKNINMLMATPIALLAKAKGDRYRKRAEAMLFAEDAEINRRVDRRPAPNFGYYAVQTMTEKPKLGRYVEAAQSTDINTTINCNPQTGSGESCTSHLGIEARGYAFASAALGRPASQYKQVVVDIMHAADARDPAMCENEKTSRGNARFDTGCVAYHCALRQLDKQFDDRCFKLVSQWGAKSQDIILGLFWGRPAH